MQLSLRIVDGRFAIVRLAKNSGMPWWAARSEGMLSFTRTADETSIVCDDSRLPSGVQAERGFRALRVEGTLSFEATGILASIAEPLARANIPIFVISTFDTDYVLVREMNLPAALRALREAGHTVADHFLTSSRGQTPKIQGSDT